LFISWVAICQKIKNALTDTFRKEEEKSEASRHTLATKNSNFRTDTVTELTHCKLSDSKMYIHFKLKTA
jgi:hypothetical protein